MGIDNYGDEYKGKNYEEIIQQPKILKTDYGNHVETYQTSPIKDTSKTSLTICNISFKIQDTTQLNAKNQKYHK